MRPCSVPRGLGWAKAALVCRQRRECDLWVRCEGCAEEGEGDCLAINDWNNVWVNRNGVCEKSALVTVSHINGMDRRPHCMQGMGTATDRRHSRHSSGHPEHHPWPRDRKCLHVRRPSMSQRKKPQTGDGTWVGTLERCVMKGAAQG